MRIEQWLSRAAGARKAAHAALSVHESSTSRVVLLEDLLKRLSGAPIDVQDYFAESIECLQRGLNRSGIVLAWAGHFYIFSETLYSRHESLIRIARPRWTFNDLSELKEQYAEAQILDVAKEVGFIARAQLRLLQGQLSHRNQCAHPTLYRPSMNSAIGYVDEMIRQTLKIIQP